jgi:MFS family permease
VTSDPHVPSSSERLVTGYSGRLLLVTATGTMLTYLARLVLSPLLPTIIDDLGVSAARAGVALTVMWGMIAVWQFPGGRASDRLSRKFVLVVALAVLGLGTGLLTGAGGYPAFLAGVTILGVGAGLYLPVSFAVASDLFVRRRGQAFGVNAAGIDVGGVLSAALAAAVLGAVDWRLAFVPVTVAVALVLGATHAWNREPYAVGRPALGVRETATRLLSERRVRLVLVMFALFAFVWQGIMSFLPTFLTDRGVSTTLASNAFAALFAVGVVSRPAAGALGDRIAHRTVAVGACLAAAAGLAVVVVVRGLVAMALGIAVLGVGLAAFWPVINAYLVGLFPTRSMAGDLGAVRSLSMVVGSLGPAYVGVVADAAGYRTAFLGFFPCLAVATALLLWLE